jgi:hypothetical protein
VRAVMTSGEAGGGVRDWSPVADAECRTCLGGTGLTGF